MLVPLKIRQLRKALSVPTLATVANTELLRALMTSARMDRAVQRRTLFMEIFHVKVKLRVY